MQRVGGAHIHGTPILQPGDIYNLTIDAAARHVRALVQHRQPPRARHAGDADRHPEAGRVAAAKTAGAPPSATPPGRAQAMNGLTAAVACAAVRTFGRFGAGTIAFAAMFVSTLRWRDSQAPISAATPFSVVAHERRDRTHVGADEGGLERLAEHADRVARGEGAVG